MSDTQDTLLISAQVEIPVAVLKTIVDNAKKAAGAGPSGIYRVDTAEAVNRIITQFLASRDFAEFASDPANYQEL